MANLPEILQFDAGVYQIETADPVLGGPNGLSNVPLKNLANRTAYLKKHVDDLEAGTTVPPGIATEAFVTAEINKLDNKQSVRAATTANITLAGTQTIDGVNLVSGDRVLVKNQTAPAENGLYVVQGAGWIRTGDADSNADVTPGLVVAVEEGALQGDTVWKLTTNAPIALGTTGLTFADITTGYAPLASPAFTGAPTAPTPAQGDNSLRIATSAFVQQAIAALVNSSPAALDTLLELAAALGNDANFATTMTNALALKAPLASPTLIGTPTAPKPAQFDSSLKLATTSFVRESGMQFRDPNIFSGAGSLLAAQNIGNLTVFYNLLSDIAVQLPPIEDCPQGGAITIRNASATYKITLSTSTGQIDPDWAGVSSIVINPGETLAVARKDAVWEAFGGSALLRRLGMFGASLAANGYQKLPSGLIVQWGTIAIGSTAAGATTSATVTYPIAFPSGALAISANVSTATIGTEFFTASASKSSASQAIVKCRNSFGGSASTASVDWIAIGY